jgi:hypothetical protein
MMRANALPTLRTVAAIAVLAACGIAPAMAQVDLSAGASVGIEYNSNPVEFSTAEAASFVAGGKKYVDDQALDLTANVAAMVGSQGPFVLNVQAMYNHVESRRFDELGHDEYSYMGSLDWKPGQLVDFTLAAEQFRDPIRQADTNSQAVTQKTTTNARATVRLHPTPRLQLAVTPGWIRIDLPLQEAPDYKFRERNGTASLTYLNPGRLAPGVEYIQSRSRNSNIGLATRYRQEVIRGTLNYQATGFSLFTLTAGYTTRTTDLVTPSTDPRIQVVEGTDSAFTGTLSYQRKFSPKTTINISAFRDLQQYEAGTNTTVGTGFNAGVVWSPTRRISIGLDSQSVWSTIEDLRVAGTTVQRKDLLRSYTVGASYAFARQLSMRGYFTRRVRNSTLSIAQFNSTIAGLELIFKID